MAEVHDDGATGTSAILAHYQAEAVKAAQEKSPYEVYPARKARFPALKTMEGFDFSFQPHLNEKEVIRLTSLDFVTQKENLLFPGPPGVGKTHLAIAFGIKACPAKYRVWFTRTQKLLEQLTVAQKTGRLGHALLSLSRLDLLIIDELGYLSISPAQANLFFQLGTDIRRSGNRRRHY